jgi:AraC-like DNA-binding protein
VVTTNIEKETERMNRVYHYLLDNFKKEIALQEIASVAHLSNEAFCRYFKKHTRKTLSEFVNELRISYACKALQQQKEVSILQVCYESGFNNVSYFNRQFKMQVGMSPLKYRKERKALR